MGLLHSQVCSCCLLHEAKVTETVLAAKPKGRKEAVGRAPKHGLLSAKSFWATLPDFSPRPGLFGAPCMSEGACLSLTEGAVRKTYYQAPLHLEMARVWPLLLSALGRSQKTVWVI